MKKYTLCLILLGCVALGCGGSNPVSSKDRLYIEDMLGHWNANISTTILSWHSDYKDADMAVQFDNVRWNLQMDSTTYDLTLAADSTYYNGQKITTYIMSDQGTWSIEDAESGSLLWTRVKRSVFVDWGSGSDQHQEIDASNDHLGWRSDARLSTSQLRLSNVSGSGLGINISEILMDKK